MQLADLMPNVVMERFETVTRSHPAEEMAFLTTFNVKQAQFGLRATGIG